MRRKELISGGEGSVVEHLRIAFEHVTQCWAKFVEACFLFFLLFALQLFYKLKPPGVKDICQVEKDKLLTLCVAAFRSARVLSAL